MQNNFVWSDCQITEWFFCNFYVISYINLDGYAVIFHRNIHIYLKYKQLCVLFGEAVLLYALGANPFCVCNILLNIFNELLHFGFTEE